MDHHHHHRRHEDQLQLQIPHFVYNSTPTLIPGGGAEVIPISNAAWFASNNGFTLQQDECVGFIAKNEKKNIDNSLTDTIRRKRNPTRSISNSNR